MSAKHWGPGPYSEVDVEPLESLTAQGIRERVLRKAWGRNHKLVLDETPASELTVDETVSESKGEAEEQVRLESGRKLTGNFVRDFPEEFARSWSAEYSPSGTALYPKDEVEDAQKAEAKSTAFDAEDDVQPSSMDESFPGELPKLEPALGRLSQKSKLSTEQKAMLNADPYSTAPQGLQTSYTEECGGRITWPTLVRHYSAKAKPSEDKDNQSTSDEPVLWKILAYDPATEAVAVAETSSSVLDSSSPSPPAEVLARLSNPSKFLPHFRSLGLQGYEIFSGSGDVMVFRKVRPSSTDADATSATAEAEYKKPTRINPIDMMGYPVTGNFASPTGFVNYDTLAEVVVDKPVPPYRSNADADRHDTLGSSQTSSSEGQTKKRSFGRKLALTTVWVAGGAYAVSVMGEYFSTGGAEGRRAKRL